MRILAIETSTLTGSVALLADDQICGEITLSVSVQHSERLMPAVDQLLRDCGMKSEEVDLYAVSQGPGSFTGLRIGIAAAQGFSLAHKKPIVGVSSLAALALNGIFFPGVVIPVFDAFRGEIYRGIYKSSVGANLDSPLPDLPDQLMSPSQLLEELSALKEIILILGNGKKVCAELIQKNLGPERVTLAPAILDTPRASQVAFLAARHTKGAGPTKEVLPIYLRAPG